MWDFGPSLAVLQKREKNEATKFPNFFAPFPARGGAEKKKLCMTTKKKKGFLYSVVLAAKFG